MKISRFLHISLVAAVLILPSAVSAVTTASVSRSTTNTVVPPPRRNVPGQRYSASLGSLYVPSFFDAARTTATDVVLFFHGAAWCAEQNFYDARKNAVLISISLKDYARVFGDPDMLTQVLDSARQKLKDEGITTAPIGRLCLVSFSAGYAAVREILAQERFRNRVTDVVLADSLYPPRIKGTEDRISTEALNPILDYAKASARGECIFFLSHLYPPEARYRNNTTTLAASFLIDTIGAKRRPANESNARGARMLYRAEKNGFRVFGIAGMTNQDHFEHFYSVADLLRQTSLDNVEQ